MSTFKDQHDSYTIKVHGSRPGITLITTADDGKALCIDLATTDAPALALAILEAAGVGADGTSWASTVVAAVRELAIQQNGAFLAIRDARRDELANEFTNEPGYETLGSGLRSAIDRIIELESRP